MGKYVSLISVAILIILFPGCSVDEDTVWDNIFSEYVSLSPNDQQILLSYYKNSLASIYMAHIDSGNLTQITFAEKDSHLGARFSPDGSKILFLSFPYKTRTPISHLNIMNLNGSNIKQITSGKKHITEAVFSPDSNTIYFIQSDYYGHYSPVAAPNPHDFDIYSISVGGSDLRRITNLSEYQMEGLSVSSDGKQLLFATFGSDKSEKTLHFLTLADNTVISSFGPVNYKGKSAMCYQPRLSPDDKKIAFYAWGSSGKANYELFLMDVPTRSVKQLTRSGGVVGRHCFFHDQDKILFTRATNWPQYTLVYELMIVNTDGSGLSKVDLTITDGRPETSQSAN